MIRPVTQPPLPSPEASSPVAVLNQFLKGTKRLTKPVSYDTYDAALNPYNSMPVAAALGDLIRQHGDFRPQITEQAHHSGHYYKGGNARRRIEAYTIDYDGDQPFRPVVLIADRRRFGFTTREEISFGANGYSELMKLTWPKFWGTLTGQFVPGHSSEAKSSQHQRSRKRIIKTARKNVARFVSLIDTTESDDYRL